MIQILVILHALLAIGLLGALTHQAVSVTKRGSAHKAAGAGTPASAQPPPR